MKQNLENVSLEIYSVNGKLIQKLHNNFCNSNKDSPDGNAKLYAACIYILIKDKLQEIKLLVICCDENPALTKKHLLNKFPVGVYPAACCDRN